MTMRLPARRNVALVCAVVASILIAWSGRSLALHDADISDEEFSCQRKSSLILAKFVAKKAQCIRSCQQTAYADGDPPTDCVPPYAGSTNGCVNSTESKTGGDGKAKCALDCPECYTPNACNGGTNNNAVCTDASECPGGTCDADCSAHIDAKVADREAHVEALAADVYCDDSASLDGLTVAENTCRNTVIKFIAAFHAKKVKCLGKCHRAEHGGKIAVGSCTPGAITDLKTQECIDKLELKVTTKLDLKCESSVNPSADKPDCGLYPTRTGANWVAAEEAVVDANDPGNFCGE